MITMILYAKFPPDHLGNTPCCPDVSTKAIRLGPFREKLRYLRFLIFGQTRLHSLRRMRVQCFHSLLSPSFKPLADSSFAHSPSATAISFCFHFCSFKLQARLRRSSRHSAFFGAPMPLNLQHLYLSLPRSVKDKDHTEFYIRAGNTTKLLDVEAAHNHISMH
jgi:hypothetical protein